MTNRIRPDRQRGTNTGSESDYFEQLRVLNSEIEEAIIIFHTTEEINHLALHHTKILQTLNEEPTFWQAYRSTCQTALFMALGRIFDSTSDAHSIQKLTSSTLENFVFFSKAALKARKMGR